MDGARFNQQVRCSKPSLIGSGPARGVFRVAEVRGRKPAAAGSAPNRSIRPLVAAVVISCSLLKTTAESAGDRN
jgi:hypothetical protein